MGSLGPEFSTQLYKDPTNVMEVSCTHSEVLDLFCLFIYFFQQMFR